MPVRTYETRSIGIPHNMHVNGYSLDNDEDVDKLNKSLVFLDLNTGLHNRLITRDPICGLGDLPAEIDPLQGCGLRHRKKESFSNGTTPVRDPILLQGDLGEEYNCLYTTKELSCKRFDDRNIITLEGYLGEELDPIRPHGGRPRSSIKNEAVRNPITGSGEFGKEWDPIYKYEGKHNLNRPLQIKRDPVTHSVPMANMGEAAPKHFYKHFDLTRNTDNVSHDESIRDLRGSEEMCHSGIRHYENQEQRNPITHQAKAGCAEDTPYKSGTKHFYDIIKNDDPIHHHGFTDDLKERSMKEDQARLQAQFRIRDNPIIHHGLSDGLDEVAAKQKQARLDAQDRVLRDPIAGTGIKEKETMTLWIYPTDYCFRSFLMPNKKSSEKPTEKSKAIATKK